MRFAGTSYASFHGWLPGRILLPLGFGAAVLVGIYAFADDHGYHRALAEQAPQKSEARLIAEEPSEALLGEAEAAAKSDREGIPGLLRAIDPTAVYHGGAEHKSSVAVVTSTAVPKHAAPHVATAMPAGVERFDRCEGACDTRDPMIIRASYQVGMTSADADSVVAPAGAHAVLAATPAAVTPAPAAPVVEAESGGFFGLPSAGAIVDRTVEGTASAYGAVKNGAAAAVDSVRGAVSDAFSFMR
ncbi:hypothetical protein FHS55_002985 [Angulomicrobium tetraedrale]|uniref:Uncharacterized protein n=1 Tax=Ancylobacter tetraedralis TaxID=217068 RepID=A0A839ZC76_9HYPH|nr:hypothetical protein [Ancylobacter tetraedralis]MBB3772373.1 hypothetical protein [Ancylobacter tetraedralis]